ncbi:MAG: uridine diphosphate-N-acetylglucosamine-binding protein YvcK [Candidatus Dojkabacteria bacterium]
MNITVIGGGTGSTVVLEGLKEYRDLYLSVIVGMMDDGGSNAVVRDEFGLLPLSDVRKSILALSDSTNNEVWRKLFVYRFNEGKGIKGHTLGNLLMIAMTEILGSELEAIEMFKHLFNVRGEVLPVTFDKVRLVAEYEDGSKVVGEHYIDEPKKHKNIVNFYLSTEAKASEEALKAIRKADFIVLGPGDIFTTILPNILVLGIKEEIQKSNGKVVYISNLMSKIGQTREKTQKDIVELIEKYLGRDLDYVLVNKGEIPTDAFKRYLKDGENAIEDDLGDGFGRKILRKDLVATNAVKKEKGDKLERSFVRHDQKKVASELYSLFNNRRNLILRFLGSLFSYYKD